MSEEEKNERIQSAVGPEFFINELARMEAAQERFNINVARRLNALEERNKGAGLDDPTKLMGSVFLVLIGLQLLPVILDMVRQWRSSSSSQLSA